MSRYFKTLRVSTYDLKCLSLIYPDDGGERCSEAEASRSDTEVLHRRVDAAVEAPNVDKPKVTEEVGDSGADAETCEVAAEGTDAIPPDMIEVDVTDEEIAPEPTEDRPDRAPAKGDVADTKAATKPEEDDK